MRYLLKLLRAHFTVEFTLFFRYPLDLASMYFVTVAILAAIFIGTRAFLPAGQLLGATKAAIFVGYFFWIFYLLTVNSGSGEITMAATQGYLEREFLTPAGHGPTIVAKILANSISGLVHYCFIAAICILLFRVKLELDAASIICVFALNYVFLVGVGLAFAGLALVFKRIWSVNSIFQMGLMVLSFAALGKYGAVAETALRWFPYTQGIRLLRAVLIEGQSFAFVATAANLGPMAAGALAFFLAGALAFHILDRVAMNRGLIGQF
jgi:ABC-2 type transport system permease protein